MISRRRPCGASVYEATGNEGAILELQYRHAALVVWQPNESALDMLAECGGRAALAGELATMRRLGRHYAFNTQLSHIARRWRRAMTSDGGGPAPEAHGTLLAALHEGEERVYAHGIAALDLDEAGAEIVARELHATEERERRDWRETLHHLVEEWPWRDDALANRSGAVALFEHLLTDDAGIAIAERMCGHEGREAVEQYVAKLRRREHGDTYQRRRDARFTRDYPGDGLRDNETGGT